VRIAAISDIHGNLGALDAVLDDIARRRVDITVNLGDILSGPLLPCETAERLMALDLPTIRGNHERQLLTDALDGMSASDRFTAVTLSSAHREWLTSLPASAWISEEVFLCHATPDSDVACFLENIRDGELIPASLPEIAHRTASCQAELIFCGHTHIARVAHLPCNQLIINPGSVGIQAYDGHHPVPHTVEVGSPHARYAIAERTESGWVVDLIAVPYDWEAAARIAERNARPDWARALRTGFVRAAPLLAAGEP
jgi:predicted phosphodiesterase